MKKPKFNLSQPTKEDFSGKKILDVDNLYKTVEGNSRLSFKEIKLILPPNMSLEDVCVEEYHYWDEHSVTYFYFEKFDEELYNEKIQEYNKAYSEYQDKLKKYEELKLQIKELKNKFINENNVKEKIV